MKNRWLFLLLCYLGNSCFKSTPTTKFGVKGWGEGCTEILLWLVMLWAGITLLELGRLKEYSLIGVFMGSLDDLCIFWALAHLLFSWGRGCSFFQLICYHFFLWLCNLVIPFALLGRLLGKKQKVLQFSVSENMSPKSGL